MFGRDGAAEPGDEIIDELLNATLGDIVHVLDCHIDVDVAVSHMPKDHIDRLWPMLWHLLAQVLDGLAHAPEWNAHVETNLLGQETTILIGCLPVGPQAISVSPGLSDYRVPDEILLVEFAQCGREGLSPFRIFPHIGLDQQRDVVLCLEGWREAADLGCDGHELAPHRLEGEQTPGMGMLKTTQHGQSILEAPHSAKRCLKPLRLWLQADHNPGNDAKRTFTANEPLRPVVAGIVL
jgi:hypothetical protein